MRALKEFAVVVPLVALLLAGCVNSRTLMKNYATTSGEAAVTQVTEAGVSRAEFVAELTDFFGWPHRDDYNDYWEDLTPAKTFGDVRKSDKYGKQIEAAYEEGIIEADASGNFGPDTPITREEAAVIFAGAWKIPDSDKETSFSDAGGISADAIGSVNALVELGVMDGRTADSFAPKEALTEDEFSSIFKALKNAVVAPVYALPRQGFDAPRRYIMLYCATPGATIYFTNDGLEPTESSYVYEREHTREGTGHIMEMLGSRGGGDTSLQTERDVVYKAYSYKDGLIKSGVRTFTWHLYRPLAADAEFESVKVVEGTSEAPTVYQVYNDSESVRAMAWYIEGPEKGILFDALQTSIEVRNLKDHIDTIATKPYICILGHEHGDHTAQAPAFIKAGIDVYANSRGWAAIGSPRGFGAVVTTPEQQSKVINVDEGDSFDLGGGIVFDVYAMPGHANGNIVLNDKRSGMVFSSDIYGCTRAGSADNVGVSGLPVDLLLSFAQQVHYFYLQGGGKVRMLFTGHDEYPLKENNLDLFEAALQQVVDNGEAGCSPDLRSNNMPNSRATTIGEMWKDNTDWISLVIGGTLGDNTEYLTHNNYMNYNGAEGYRRYSVLSNVELTEGDLVGTTVEWAGSNTFEWSGKTITVPNAIPDRFDPWTFDYKINVASGTSNITICPVTMSKKVTSIKLNGKKVAYRSINRVGVSDGSVITIEVVAPDGTTSSTYTFTVNEV